MTTAALSTRKLSAVSADAAVVALGSSPDGPRVAVPDLPTDSVDALEAAASALGFRGTVGETLRLPGVEGLEVEQVVVVGVGAPDDVSTSVLRRAAGSALRAVTGAATVLLVLPVDGEPEVRAATEGALLGAYSFARYKTGEQRTRVSEVLVHAGGRKDKATRAAVEAASVTAQVTALARDLVNTSPLDLPPAAVADRAQAEARSLPVKVTVLDEKQLARKGYGGIVAVGMGSTRPPRLVVLEYAPSRARSHVALVGKGITFDSGGLSLKPPASMPGMKADMAGSAAVLAAVLGAARLGLPVKVTGYLALAENMPSGSAQRPSDVITMYGGKTVEVLNTDAEGRLVLADAIVAAAEQKPDAIIDVATLTGAQVVALGPRVAGVMGNDDSLREEVLRGAEEAGDDAWPMPLPAHLRSGLDSPVADLANVSMKREGGMLSAGLFLKEFVGERADGSPLPWAHIDIAGPAFNEGGAFDHVHKGGTGAAVGTLLRLLENRGR